MNSISTNLRVVKIYIAPKIRVASTFLSLPVVSVPMRTKIFIEVKILMRMLMIKKWKILLKITRSTQMITKMSHTVLLIIDDIEKKNLNI